MSLTILIGADATLNCTATAYITGEDKIPPAVAVAAARNAKGGRLMVAEFQVRQVLSFFWL